MYNPFDLLQLVINGHPIDGRPTEFDGTPNVGTEMVKPTRVNTVCPDCGSGLEFSLHLPDPPFGVLAFTCTECNPAATESQDPFMNPIHTGRIAPHELDPLLHNPDNQVVNDGKTVADRFAENALETPPVDSDDEMALDKSLDFEDDETAKKVQGDPSGPNFVTKSLKGPIVPLAPAEEMSAEVDFDDDDLVEKK